MMEASRRLVRQVFMRIDLGSGGGARGWEVMASRDALDEEM